MHLKIELKKKLKIYHEQNKNKFYGVNDDLWGHKWGFKDSSFIINDDNTVTFTGKDTKAFLAVPYLIPFVTKVLNTEIKKSHILKR